MSGGGEEGGEAEGAHAHAAAVQELAAGEEVVRGVVGVVGHGWWLIVTYTGAGGELERGQARAVKMGIPGFVLFPFLCALRGFCGIGERQ